MDGALRSVHLGQQSYYSDTPRRMNAPGGSCIVGRFACGDAQVANAANVGRKKWIWRDDVSNKFKFNVVVDCTECVWLCVVRKVLPYLGRSHDEA